MVLGLMFGGRTREVKLSPIGDAANDAFVAEDLEACVATDAADVSIGIGEGVRAYSLTACALPGRT